MSGEAAAATAYGLEHWAAIAGIVAAGIAVLGVCVGTGCWIVKIVIDRALKPVRDEMNELSNRFSKIEGQVEVLRGVSVRTEVAAPEDRGEDDG